MHPNEGTAVLACKAWNPIAMSLFRHLLLVIFIFIFIFFSSSSSSGDEVTL